MTESGSALPVIKILSVFLILAVLGIGLLLVVTLDDGIREKRYDEASAEPYQETSNLTVVKNSSEEESSYSNEEPITNVSELSESDLEERLLHQINEKRRENGLDEVRRYKNLSETARSHSINMSENGYVAHVDPSGQDVSRYSRDCAGLPGVGNYTYSENLARTWYGRGIKSSKKDGYVFLTSEKEVAKKVTELWMNSDPHRRKILDGKWRSTGIGVEVNETGAVFVTQSFCTEGKDGS